MIVSNPRLRPPLPFTLSLIATTVIMTWIYRGTSQSLFMAVLYHAFSDLTLAYAGTLTSPGDTTRIFWLLAITPSAIATTIVIANGPTWLTRPAPS